MEPQKMSTIPFILIAIAMATTGQLLVKFGLNRLGHLDFSTGFIITYLKICFTPLVVLGASITLASAFFWIYALTKVDLSYASPFLALSYLMVLLCSWVFLGENIPLIRWVGILIISFGVYLVTKS
jgi:drug/metabolite transporter (DMT)-like permease